MKKLSLRILKHYNSRRQVWLFFGKSDTKQLTMGTNVSLFAVTLHRTNCWNFDSF